MRTRFPALAAALAVAMVMVMSACGGSATPSPAPSLATVLGGSGTPVGATPTAVPATPIPAPTTSPAATGSPVPTVSADCAASSLATLTPGKLTISTDNPAYAPWWGGTPPSGSDWSGGYPPSGEGFESAAAYAIANALGYTKDDVIWVAQTAFGNAFKAGPKNFDIHLGQVSYSAKRAKAVDLSDSYYDVNQAVVGLASNRIAQTTTMAGLKAFKLGAAGNTTSYETITDTIQPTQEALAYDDNDKAVRALGVGQIDGLVVDLPTSFYIRDVQLAKKHAVIVGQIPTQGEQEHFSVVLAKGSPITACVNQAIGIIKADGTWQSVYDEWLADKASAPVFK